MSLARTTFVSILALLFTCQAHAISISSAGDNWTVDWSTTTTNGSLLSAESTWSVNSFSATSIVLDITMHNTTSLLAPNVLDNAAILSFGFGIDPNATAVLTSTGSVFVGIGEGSGPNQTFPGDFKNIDVCIYSDGCSGGAINTGLQAGDSDAVRITLSGDFSGGSAELMPFPVKFQTSNGSYEPDGCVNCNGEVPAPAILGLMGIGLMGMVASSGIRRRKAS